MPNPTAPHFSPDLSASACRSLTRSPATSRRYVRVLVQAPSAPRAHVRPPVHVAFVIDRSGSMMGEKLTLACKAVDHALGMLGPEDRFAIVAFDNVITVPVPACAATPHNVASARAAVAAIQSGNSTNISDAWIEGCQQIAAAAGTGPILRTLLLTDGQANAGITKSADFAPHLAALRDTGVVTSVFGLGLDFDEEFLASVARAGGGNFYFIREAGLIADFFTKELGESLEVVAPGANLAIHHPTSVGVKPLSDFPSHRRTPGVLEIPLPDLVSNQQLEILLSVDIPSCADGDVTALSIAISDPKGVFAAVRPVSIAWTGASHLLNDAQPRDVLVDRAVARIYAARAERDAIRYNRRREFERARHVLTSTHRRIASYAGDDAELSQILSELNEKTQHYTRIQDEMSLKTMHAGTVYATRSREPDGFSKKRG
jgi:Ca-activated chloride channel family protein